MNITSISDSYTLDVRVRKIIEVVPFGVSSNSNPFPFIYPNHDIPLGGKLYY